MKHIIEANFAGMFPTLEKERKRKSKKLSYKKSKMLYCTAYKTKLQ